MLLQDFLLSSQVETCWYKRKTTGLIVESAHRLLNCEILEKLPYFPELSWLMHNIGMIILMPTVVPMTRDNTDRRSHSRCSVNGRYSMWLRLIFPGASLLVIWCPLLDTPEPGSSKGRSAHLLPTKGLVVSWCCVSGGDWNRSQRAGQTTKKIQERALGWKPEKPDQGGRQSRGFSEW